jgi:hypothetical protein
MWVCTCKSSSAIVRNEVGTSHAMAVFVHLCLPVCTYANAHANTRTQACTLVVLVLDPQQCSANPGVGWVRSCLQFLIGMFIMDTWQASTGVFVYVCVCACVCVRACVRVCG